MLEYIIIAIFIWLVGICVGMQIAARGYWRKFFKLYHDSECEEELFCKMFVWSPLELIKNYFNKNFYKEDG